MRTTDLTAGERQIARALRKQADLTAAQLLHLTGRKYKAGLDRDLQFLRRAQYIAVIPAPHGGERYRLASA